MKVYSIFFYIIFPVLLSAQVDTAWVRRYDGPGFDEATAIAVDNSGYVYVTGGSESIYFLNLNYRTIKYSPDGVVEWIRGYVGPGDGYDEACAIAVDNSGYVYVTGTSTGSISAYDYATIKYDPDGDSVWVKIYNGPVNDYDQASSLALDNPGNVYVTGTSVNANMNSDYATIKYYPNGDTAWIRRYNGPGDENDEAEDVGVDDSGNVYVAGGSIGYGTSDDYATIKYNSAGGLVWIKRYNSPENADDFIYALAVDGSGNVYVTGINYDTLAYASRTTTIKYYPNGDTAWVRRYDGSSHEIAVDDLGNVYVTGNWDDTINMQGYIRTIKYYPNGDTAWVRRYNCAGHDNASATAMALDSMGNIYITGNLYLSGSDDRVTMKYYPNGDMAWVTIYNGSDIDIDLSYDLAVDNSGNVYVTGIVYDTTTWHDYETIKYAPTGEVDESFIPRSSPVKFDVFPNPARNYFTVRLLQPAAQSTIRIYDVTGKKIKELTDQARTSGINIPMTDVVPGVYFVRVDGISAVGKIIVTK